MYAIEMSLFQGIQAQGEGCHCITLFCIRVSGQMNRARMQVCNIHMYVNAGF